MRRVTKRNVENFETVCLFLWMLLLPFCAGEYFPLMPCQSQVHVESLSHGFLKGSQVRTQNTVNAFAAFECKLKFTCYIHLNVI